MMQLSERYGLLAEHPGFSDGAIYDPSRVEHIVRRAFRMNKNEPVTQLHVDAYAHNSMQRLIAIFPQLALSVHQGEVSTAAYCQQGLTGATSASGTVTTETVNGIGRIPHYAPFGHIVKHNERNPAMNALEARIASGLTRHTSANFCTARVENGHIVYEEAGGINLGLYLYHQGHIMGVMSRGKPEGNYVVTQLKQLMRESMAIANILSDESYGVLTTDMKRELEEISSAKCKGKELASYDALSLADLLCLEGDGRQRFFDSFSPLQRVMDAFNQKYPLWTSDRVPYNKNVVPAAGNLGNVWDGKNFDANNVRKASIAREIGYIMDKIPGTFIGSKRVELLTAEEHESLVKFMLAEHNSYGRGTINYDDEFLNAYHSERFVRSVLRMTHCLRQARSAYDNEASSAMFFGYAKLLSDAQWFYQNAGISLANLVTRKALSQGDAISLMNSVRQFYHGNMQFAAHDDVVRDLELYYSETQPAIIDGINHLTCSGNSPIGNCLKLAFLDRRKN